MGDRERRRSRTLAQDCRPPRAHPYLALPRPSISSATSSMSASRPRSTPTSAPPTNGATTPCEESACDPGARPSWAAARQGAIQTGLALGAGIGAAITLMLAFRRQRHQELATLITAHDATERQVTELYTKAVEQLGSDKAAVRLGGLYALERVAQDNPGS